MTTAGGRPTDAAKSRPLQAGSELTWRKLAERAGIAERDAVPLRRVERFRPGTGHQGIVALVRELADGCEPGSGAYHGHNRNDDHDHDHGGHGG